MHEIHKIIKLIIYKNLSAHRNHKIMILKNRGESEQISEDLFILEKKKI